MLDLLSAYILKVGRRECVTANLCNESVFLNNMVNVHLTPVLDKSYTFSAQHALLFFKQWVRA